ncbi:Peptidase family M28 [Hymenobacter daecheongensis DSM 21074]|uniref:Peptidase family M28 n=2 Tax=Hymenobacter daecheongensis TaxID=496053 RepID=A0A1M6LDZ5_9BACT|nr:Peptidase family M28 [Hymenobacter daecheongensis DSM 21074]
MGLVRETITTLAAPAMHGRGYVRHGSGRAASYLARRFKALGLRSFTPGYAQPFALTVNTFPGAFALRLDGRPLQPGFDFIAEPASGSGRVTGPLLPLDSLIFTNEAAGQRFLTQPLSGRIVVLRQRDAERLRTLPDAFAEHLNQAAALITLVPTKLTASLAATQHAQPRLQVLASRWANYPQQATVEVTARLEPDYPTRNVIGYVPGRVQPDSFLVVTAHYDHLGRMGKKTFFPGANDNASGTAMLLALAEYYAQPENQPAYSVAFMAFGAEEAGLLGSRHYVAHPLFPLSRIRFLINMDLLGTGEEGMTVVNGKLLDSRFQQLMRLNEAGRFVPQLAARGRAANSDHFPFSEQGVPAFFFYTRGGPTAYHDVHDQPATLPLTAFRGVYQLTIQFLNLLGARPATPPR